LKVSFTACFRYAGQFIQELPVVLFVGGAGPGVAGGKDPRPAVQSFNDQPGVVGQRPFSCMKRYGFCLLEGVLEKRCAVFNDLRISRVIFQRRKIDPQPLEDRADFRRLAPVFGSDYYPFQNISPKTSACFSVRRAIPFLAVPIISSKSSRLKGRCSAVP